MSKKGHIGSFCFILYKKYSAILPFRPIKLVLNGSQYFKTLIFLICNMKMTLIFISFDVFSKTKRGMIMFGQYLAILTIVGGGKVNEPSILLSRPKPYRLTW